MGLSDHLETPKMIRKPIALSIAISLLPLLAVSPGWAARPVDDAAAVQELSTLATGLKRDKDGYVVEVNFRGAKIDDGALGPLAGLRRLRGVLLNNTGVTDAGMATLGEITTLRNLDLRGCKIGNAGLGRLVGLQGLRGLKLSGRNGRTTVDDQGMAALGELKNLKALALDFLWVSEEGLSHLQGFEKLEELYLAKTLVGDEALALLRQFPRLKKLRISQNQVTDAGMVHLADLPQLEDLDLSENGQLSDAGMAPCPI